MVAPALLAGSKILVGSPDSPLPAFVPDQNNKELRPKLRLFFY